MHLLFASSTPVTGKQGKRAKRCAAHRFGSPRARIQSLAQRSRRCETISRRAMLVCTAAAAVSLGATSSAQAYSSPYRPDQRSDKPLPDRLYEEATKRVVTTPTGLQYFDLAEGSGATAADGDTVFVYFTSRLRGLNGIKIESNADDANNPPFIFKIGDGAVVPGVSEAVRGMKVGGKRRAVLPPSIAYASADMKPAVTEFFARRRLLSVLETSRDATIVFDFELVKVK